MEREEDERREERVPEDNRFGAFSPCLSVGLCSRLRFAVESRIEDPHPYQPPPLPPTPPPTSSASL